MESQIGKEKQKLRSELLELRYQETIRRHLADKEPEEYKKITGRIKVVKRKMANLNYQKIKRKGR